MKITIKRYTQEPEIREALIDYDVVLEDSTLLEALTYIKTKIDPTLSFASGCRSSVCGSCSMRANEKEVLACAYKIKDGDVVEPLLNAPIVRDLVVDMDKAYKMNHKAKAWMANTKKELLVTPQQAQNNALQSDCILCGSCYSSCPVYAVNEEFLGPFALTRVWRYVNDMREESQADKITNIQTNGVWDCTLCNNCTLVCPQDISSKQDIEKLRMKSVQQGFSDPNFASFGGGFGFDGTPSF